nr:ATP-binding cassette sub-family A member 3-like isoform X1 [Onthophagus taurus]
MKQYPHQRDTNSNLNKFIVLTWKNWLLQWRHPIQTAIEILAPVIFSALLVLIRSLVEPEKCDTTIYDAFPVQTGAGVFNSTYTFTRLVWSPCENTALQEIMNNIVKKYDLKQVCKNNSLELEQELERNMMYTLAGIDFGDDEALSNSIKKESRVALRFPAELRVFREGLIFTLTWSTHLLFPTYHIPGPRVYEENTGANPSYYDEGFLTLQYDISREIIKYHMKINEISDNTLPTVMMERFPYPSWISDPLLQALQNFVGIIVMLSFVYSCINTVKVITDEKEKQLKEAMKIIGIPSWMHWTAWFLKILTFLSISITLMVILAKVSWRTDAQYNVFSLTKPMVLFLFLLLYVFAIITFCFLVSVFFTKANTAAAVAGLVWFLSYCPYLFLHDHYNELSLLVKLGAMLGFNTAMAYGFQLIIMFEGSGEGLHWTNLFSTVNPEDNLSMAHVMAMLLFDATLYMIITLYVEALYPGEYGVPKAWYFPLTVVNWPWQKAEILDRITEERDESEIYEREPTNLKPGIIIRKLTKVYANKKVAVKDLTLTMFEGQITVLLGHNGAGKTTTMSMLTGMTPPTSGTAIINGYDLRTGIDNIRSSLGLCAQHNILFDDLTVEEHLYFFSRLKGMRNKAELKSEVDKFIELLDLVPKRTSISKSLSGGMKRKLCFAIAFCGKSKVCLFDEPTAGMDPAARRALWDFIQTQKKDRTILLSTHFMDEADLLGDRIAIMAGGQLQCCGSSFFLKKKYGAGYHLVMEKSADCDVDDVTDLLSKYIPSITVNSNVGSELTYVLAKEESENFEKMLQDIENNSETLGISNFGISLTTMEEVFMKVGTYQGLDDEKKLLSVENELRSDVKVTIGDNKRLRGWELRKNHFIAMMMKKIIYSIRTWILFLIQNILPVIFLITAVVVSKTIRLGDKPEKMDFSLHPYDNPITVVSTSNETDDYFLSYLNALKSDYLNVMTFINGNMITNMLEQTRKYESDVRMKYIIGSSFLPTKNTIIAWFNNEPYHSPPLSLQYVMNAIFQQKMNSSDYNILFSNYPLPYSPDTKMLNIKKGNTLGFQIAFNVGFSMAFVASFYILFCVKDRVINSKHLQFVSGLSASMYWLTAYLWDFVTFVFTTICLVGTLVCFQEEGFKTVGELSRLSILLLLFGLAMLPEMYLASFLFRVASTGYTRMTLVNIFLGTTAFMTVQVLSIEALELQYVADILQWFFLCVPHYALSSGIQAISLKISLNKLCTNLNQMLLEQFKNTTGSELEINFACELQQACCGVDENFLSWQNNGIGRHISFLSTAAVVFTIILLISEERIHHHIRFGNRCIPEITDEQDEPDVLEEKRKVRMGEITPRDYSIVLKDVTKCYNKHIIAVNQLCLGVKGAECFGLLGLNGAGKTTTFKMMTGDITISKGDIWIYGWNAQSAMKHIHKNIGYCPQFDALIYDFTGIETLTMYCLLRGITLNESKVIAKMLSREFDFLRHSNKRVRYYSGGTKRKLSAAIAVINDPPIIFLDEPTTGMDPVSRRKIWNTFCRLRDSGKCLILTSHSMEECEALCTRLAIMVNGIFKCLGTTQHLKNKYSQGYTLTIKIKRPESGREINKTDIEPIEQFVRNNFPNAVLQERYQELLTFYINDKRLKWSVMFGLMETAKKYLNIEDYSLGQCSLEQVFLSFTKFQRKS